MGFADSTAVEVLTGRLSVARKYAANPDEWPLAPRFDPAKRWFHRLSEEHDPEGPDRFDLKVIVVCLAGGFAAWKRAGLPVREVAVAANRSN